MPDSPASDPQVIGSIDELNQPLRARVDAVEDAQQRALDKADRENRERLEKAEAALRAKIEAADIRLSDSIAATKEVLRERTDALDKLTKQFQEQQQYALEVATTEREKSANQLRVQYEKAMERADAEREKAAQALRDALSREIQAGDSNLKMHIEAQISQIQATIEAGKEQVRTAFLSSEKAIAKQDAAYEKRFEAFDRLQGGLQSLGDKNLPRELFEQAQTDNRRRQDQTNVVIQELSIRMTEMEARGTGGKDYAADLKATLAIGVAVIAVIVSAAISLLAMFSV